MDQTLHELTDGLPGWLGIVFVVVVVGAGWFGISRLFRWAGTTAERRGQVAAAHSSARAQRPGYAAGPAALAADPDAFALAASAWLAPTREQPIDVFAFPNTGAIEHALQRYYGLGGPNELWERLVVILTEGHRSWPHGDAEGPIDFVAWDLVRVIDLARAGAGLGLFGEAEARGVARFAASALQARYAEWASFGAQLERAYRHSHEPRSSHGERLARIECDGIRSMVSGADGPWSVVAWSTPVPPADLRLIDGAISDRDPARFEAWERPVLARLRQD